MNPEPEQFVGLWSEQTRCGPNRWLRFLIFKKLLGCAVSHPEQV